MSNELSPTAVITSTKSASNPTFNFDSFPDGAPILVDGTWYVAYQGNWDPGGNGAWDVRIASASSITGPWTASSAKLSLADVAWAVEANLKLSAPELHRFGETFYLYFCVVNWVTGTDGRIGVATASSVTGTYTDSGSAILSPGASGAWDSLRVAEPSVLYDGTQYVMAFMAETDADSFTNSEKVGIATGPTPTGPFTKSSNNPVMGFGSAGAWDDEVVADPTIFIDSGYYWIWYTGGATPPDGSPWSCGLAYATDPEGPWNRHASNPILSEGGAGWDDLAAFRGGIVKVDGTYHAVYSGIATASAAVKGGNATLTVTTSTDDVGIWIDVNGDGFGTTTSDEAGTLARMLPEGGGTIDDNITADVISYSINRGLSTEITGGAATDSCTIIVQNSDGKYSPDNSGSSYGPYLVGRPVWIGVNGDGTVSGAGTVYGRFAGIVREVAPIPIGGETNTATAEIICDGILSDYALTPVTLSDSTTRSQQAFRFATLLAAGETLLRMDLDAEADTLPLSSVDSTNALSVLEDLNRATGTRHFIRPSNSLHHWYDYTTRNRHYKLGAAVDDSIDAGAQHLTAVDGWRWNNDGIINSQRATIDPISFTPASAEVWAYDQVPFGVNGNVVIWANFDDYVASPVLSANVSSGSLTSILTPFGRSAKIELSGSGVEVTELSIEGAKVVRDSSITLTSDYTAEAAPSQARYRVRAGSDLSGDLLGSQASAQGIVDHIILRYAPRPLRRPKITVANWLPNMFDLDPYDLLGVTIAAVSASGIKFEIVGIDETCTVAAAAGTVYHEISFQLAESPIQGTASWFTLNTSTLGGSDSLGY